MTQRDARARQELILELSGQGERFQRAYDHVKGTCRTCKRGYPCRGCLLVPCIDCHRCDFDDLDGHGVVRCTGCGRVRPGDYLRMKA